jgi:hypothetical protein
MNMNFTLYNYLQNEKYDEIEKIINNLNMDDNSILTNILTYYIIKNDNKNIKYLLNNKKLMKRDYLKLIKYYYNNKLSKEIFNKYIIINKLENKDIDFLIENKLYDIIKLLNGVYIYTSIEDNLINDFTILKKYKLKKIYLNEMYEYIKKQINQYEIDLLHKYLNNIEYDIILDGGNIIYSDNNEINYELLYKIIDKIKNKFKNPLLIIHNKHKKYINVNISCYYTPYKINDDYYILLSYIKNTNSYILTNDKYRDHLYNNNQLKYNIYDNIINYDLENINNYSSCIQIINNDIYIPTINNKFIKLNNQNQ